MEKALMILLVLGIYMTPTLIAVARDHRNLTAIFLLNVLTGWTGLGWLWALIWSVMAQPKEPEEPKT
jgi:hypothetical protein